MSEWTIGYKINHSKSKLYLYFDKTIQFILYAKLVFFPLERPISEWRLGKQSLFEREQMQHIHVNTFFGKKTGCFRAKLVGTSVYY